MREKQYIIKYNGKHFSTIHLTAVPGISVAEGGERELASAEVQESDTVRDVGPFYLRGGQAVFRFDGGHIYISLKDDHQPHFFYYHLKDHLGSNRVTKVGVGEGGSVLQRMNYYPFGEISEQTDNTSNAMPWKFGGKELDQMHGLDLYDFHARPYDARLGQFTMIDPCAEKYYYVSPYVYCLNSPVNLVDRDGMKPDSLSAALMSKLAYGYDKEAYNELINQGWSFCSHHASASGFKYNIYKKKKSDNSYEYTCAYAGTDADSGVGDFLKDAANDVINYVGGIAPQYAEAISTSLKISGESELTFVGHSLGGGLAALSSMVTGKDAITFNAASVTGLLKVAGQAISSFRGGVITQYRSVGSNFLSGDPVNTFQNLTHRPSQGKVIPVKVGKNFSHGIQDIINAFHRNR